MFAFSEIVPSLRMLVVLTALTGVVYPLVVTGIAQMAFSSTANGSLIVVNGKILGSSLIGQPFDDRFEPGCAQSPPGRCGEGSYQGLA